MTGITVSTKELIDVLTDGLRAANDRGIHIATYRAPYLDEPGNCDLLAVTSSTGYVLGHTWIRCDGQLRHAAVWPTASAATVLSICKSLVKKGDENNEHTVDIHMVMAEVAADAKEGDHPGWTVTLSETPALFDSDTEFQFHAHAEWVFPIDGVRRMLWHGPLPEDAKVPEATALTRWSSHVLEPLVKIAARRGEPIQFFRSPDRLNQRVQIGLTWLGAAQPRTIPPGEGSEEPTVEPVFGEADLVTLLQGMADDGVTVRVENPRGPLAQTIAEAAAHVESGDEQ